MTPPTSLHHCYGIVPPHLLRGIAESAANDEFHRQAALTSLAIRENHIKHHFHSHTLAVGGTNVNEAALSGQDGQSRDVPAEEHTKTQSSCFIPETVFKALSESPVVDEKTKAIAQSNISQLCALNKAVRSSLGHGVSGDVPRHTGAEDDGFRFVYSAEHSENMERLPGVLERREAQNPVRDQAVNEAYDNCGQVISFYRKIFDWDSVDNKGMNAVSSVHFGKHFDNASELGRGYFFATLRV